MSSLLVQWDWSLYRLPRHLSSGDVSTANIGAQVGTVRATIWPLRTTSGWSRTKIGVEPKNEFSVSVGPWRTSLYFGGLDLPTVRRMLIRACEGEPRNSLKKPTSSLVVLVSFVEGLDSVTDQATTLPSNGAS